jgi:perosamine synthetase
MYAVALDQADQRDPMMAELSAQGIETRPFFYPVHHFPMYAASHTDQGCPVATDLSYRGLCLPTSPYLKQEEVAFIAAALQKALPARRPSKKSPTRTRRPQRALAQ